MTFDDDGKPPVGHLGKWHRRAVYGALAASFGAIFLELPGVGIALLGVTVLLSGTMILRFRRDPLRHWFWGSKLLLCHHERGYRGPFENVFLGLLATKTGSILVGLVVSALGVGVIAVPVLGVGPLSPLV